MLQSFFQFVSHEVAMIRPPLETFCNQIMREPFELAITVFHLIVLRIEYHRLLNLFYIALVEDVFANT